MAKMQLLHYAPNGIIDGELLNKSAKWLSPLVINGKTKMAYKGNDQTQSDNHNKGNKAQCSLLIDE